MGEAARGPSILMTADNVGGVFTYAVELARALDLRITLATMGAPLSPAQRRALAALPHVTVEESAFRLEWMEDPWDDVARAGEWFLGLEARHRPDVVHLNGYAHAALPFRRRPLVVAHSDVVSWYRAVRGHDPGPEWDRYRAAVAAGLGAAAAIVAPSAAMRDALAAAYPSITKRGRVIWNARDPRPFCGVGPDDKEPFVLAVGRLWDEAKNLAALVAAAPRVPWPVRVAGEVAPPGRDGRDGDGRAATHNLEPLGRLDPDAIAALMCRAAVFAHPARYEPFGLAVLEAALAGCALVLGDIPSLRELWDGCARFVPPGDVDALAAAIDDLAGSPRLRHRLAARARMRAARFTPRRLAAAYRLLYEELSLDMNILEPTACA